jgi:isochorismate pyruvate lyase
MPEPSECRSLSEIREEVDRIDHALLELLGRRWQYGRAAVRFKTSEADIQAPSYLPVFLERRQAWGAAVGLPPEYVQVLFRRIAEASIAEQLRSWREGRSTPAE